MIHYFAYGSNLHPVRLNKRVPSAELVGVATHHGHRLSFHKRSKDGSGKCNLFATDRQSDRVHGAIYRLDEGDKARLDRFEGRGCGYLDRQILLLHDEREYRCFAYFAQSSHIADGLRPYHWYKALVVSGARYLGFPEAYVASIEAIGSMQDPDHVRRREHERIIEEILDYR